MNRKLRKLFMVISYRSYGNLARLFMRIFAGLLFLQFGIRQIANFDYFSETFPSMWGMSSQTTLVMMITVEVVCSILVLFGFLTRLAAIPPVISMMAAEFFLLHGGIIDFGSLGLGNSAVFASMPLGYVPLMFMGMFFFIVLAGPGKVSVDYLVTLYFVNKNNLNELTTM
jgi:putative oxidoreductase